MPRCRKCYDFLAEDDLHCPQCGERQRNSLPEVDEAVPRSNRYADAKVADWEHGALIARGQPSGMATSSLVLAIIGGLFWAAIFGAGFYFQAQGGAPGAGLEMAMACTMFIACGLHAVGLGLGIAGTMKQNASNKWMAVVGLIISLLGIIGFVVILLLAWAMMNNPGFQPRAAAEYDMMRSFVSSRLEMIGA